MRMSRLEPVLALLLGCCCVCAVSLTGGRGIRVSDVGMLGAAACTLALLPSINFQSRVVRLYVLIAALSSCWVWAEFQYGALWGRDNGTTMVLVRWLVAIPAAYFIHRLSETPSNRRLLIVGLAAGLLVDISLLGYDYFSFELTGRPAFVSDHQVWYVNGTFRASGIEGGPNAASVGADFVVPVVLGAATEFRLTRWPAIPAAALALFVYIATQSRGEFAIAACLILIYVLKHPPGRTAMLAGLGVAFVAVSGLLISSVTHAGLTNAELSELVSRFTNMGAIQGNADLREMTIWNSVGLALSNPLGMGASYPNALAFSTGYDATHNGFLQLALLGGLPLTAVIVGLLARGGIGIIRGLGGIRNWLAAYIIGICCFEAVFYEPYLPLLLLWAIGATTSRSRASRPRFPSSSSRGVLVRSPKAVL